MYLLIRGGSYYLLKIISGYLFSSRFDLIGWYFAHPESSCLWASPQSVNKLHRPQCSAGAQEDGTCYRFSPFLVVAPVTECRSPRLISPSAHLQGDDPQVDVLPHAHLHVELRQALIGVGARRSDLLAGGDVLREVQHVPLD